MNKNKIFYIVFYSCFILYWYIGLIFANLLYDFKYINILLILVGSISFIFMWINSKFSKKEIFYQTFLLLFLLAIFILSGKDNYGILTFFPAIVGLKNIKIKSATKTMFYTLLFSCLVTIGLCILGLIPTGLYTKVDAFGYSRSMIMIANQHGNTMFVVLYNMLASFLYSYFDKIKKNWFIIILILVIASYLLLASRTGLILSLLTIIGIYYYRFIDNKKIKNNKLFGFLLSNSYLIFYFIVFIIGSYMSNTKIYEILNKVVSSRILEVKYYLEQYGIGLLPKSVKYYFICDNTQVKVMVSYGLIFMVAYFILVYKAIKKLYKSNKKVEIFLMIMYLLYSYSEVAFFKPVSDFTVLFLAYGFSNLKILDLEEEKYEKQN